eukprot:1161265-Pelagomonas_calceolata.AAC.15
MAHVSYCDTIPVNMDLGRRHKSITKLGTDEVSRTAVLSQGCPLGRTRDPLLCALMMSMVYASNIQNSMLNPLKQSEPLGL